MNRKALIKKIGVVAWSYAAVVVLWFALHYWLGDSIWWLALLSSFAPFLFMPLALILPICFVYRQRVLWMSVVLPIAIFLVLYGNLFLPTLSPSKRRETPLTIMTFNIWGYSQSKETSDVVLDKIFPDIVVLQELGPKMADILIEEGSDKYPYHVTDIGERTYGIGVFSRYPLTELDSSHLSDSDWQVQILQVEYDGRTFVLYNVHLQAPNILIYLEEGIPIAHGVEISLVNRRSQAQRLVADIAERGTPVIVAGDFNSTDQSDVYRILTGSLLDTHRSVGWGFGHTFPSYRGSWKGVPILSHQMRIDMIFCSQEFVALSSKVADVYGESDHLPVVAQIAWSR